ncbi:MAG: NPCBM/NEW2 domain-containing protein [Bacteroidetes bacterium]|nr:NPCBM/NEW2 domain-containing protein [Bacteroidota bacterium]
MKKIYSLFLTAGLCLSTIITAQTTHTVWLDDLPMQTFSEAIRPVSLKSNYGHDTMRMSGVRYQRGVGVQSISILVFDLDKKATQLSALVGLDDMGNKEIPLIFYVLGDKKILFQSPEMKMGDAPIKVEVDLTGIKQLGLLITDKIGGISNKRTYANWANAKLEMYAGHQPGHMQFTDEKYILTPKPSPQPRINSAKVFGATPGNPFLYTIAATGERPMQFSAQQLPEGLSVSAATGIITGTVAKRGIYTAILNARNRLGEATQKLQIKIGDTIALTPPIGWNGWNSWESKIDREKVLASAHAMVNKGLRDHGWTYINIDDAWQGTRTGKDTALQPNEKFPDIKGMIDEIHAMGLKAGLYSTPYIASYAGYVGASSDYPAGGETHELIKVNRPPFSRIAKYKFEPNDARQMAAWGVDFLKYDWRIDVASTERMSQALRNAGRDIVLSLSNNAPFEKVKDWVRLSNMYRTGPDIKDSWNSLYQTSFSLDKWGPYTGPGHWADPDMMIVGDVSIGPVLHPTRLTPDEQYSHVSIFSLLSAPMLIGCPIERLGDFTLSLLSNDEVIAVNQDPLGKAARLVADTNGVQTWLKPLEDGSYAVGLFNIDGFGTTPQSYFRWGNESARSYVFDFAALGLKGKWKIRDLWRQKDLGHFQQRFPTRIPYHGVVMLRLTKQ